MQSTVTSLPPGSQGLPLIGETLRFLFDPGFLGRRYDAHGAIFKTHIFFRPTVIMSGVEANRFLLSTGMEHFSWKEGWPITFKTLLGESLFVQDGDEHRQKRKLLMPAFHREALKQYLTTMETITQRYLARWEHEAEFAWFDENKKLTFEIASVLLTGGTEGDDAQTAELSRLFTDLTNGLIALPVNIPGTPYGKALRARNALLRFIEARVRERQQTPGMDALSLLVLARDEDGNALELRELVAQALLLLFAGHETTTSMITSFCMCLAQHPEVMAKARAEQAQFATDAPISYEDIRQMTYLEQVLKEVERMYAPVPGGFRGVVKPFEFNGYHVPKGWQVLYTIPTAHNDPKIYGEPDRFDPERFAPDRAEDKPFSLVGFGAGPRVCLGYAFAQMEMKVIAALLLRRWQWELLPEQRLDYVMFPTLRPRDGLRVRFTALGKIHNLIGRCKDLQTIIRIPYSLVL
jgi:cytochrome P450